MEFKKGQWLRLIAFCTLAGLAAALGLAAVFASASLAFASPQSAEPATPSPAQVAVFAGVVTDSQCIAKHRFVDRSPAECTRVCVRDGAKYSLVDGDKVYELTGDAVALSQFAGERASVSGTLQGNSIQVKSISH